MCILFTFIMKSFSFLSSYDDWSHNTILVFYLLLLFSFFLYFWDKVHLFQASLELIIFLPLSSIQFTYIRHCVWSSQILFLLKKYFLFLSMCVDMYTAVHVPPEVRGGHWIHGIGVPDACELPNMDAGNRSQVPKRRMHYRAVILVPITASNSNLASVLLLSKIPRPWQLL